MGRIAGYWAKFSCERCSDEEWRFSEGKYVSEEELRRTDSKSFGALPHYGSGLDKLRYFLDNRELFFQNLGYKIKEAIGR